MPKRENIYQRAMNEGHSAAWDQDWKKAAAAYRQALPEFPDQPRALNSLGLALYQLGEFDEALRTYQNGQNKEAAEVITQILLMNPPNARDYRQLLAQIEK